MTYKIYESADALVTALKGKSIDLCAHLTSSQTAQLDSDFQILEGTMNLVQAVYLNNAVAPLTTSRCVRPCATPSTARPSWT